MYYENKGVFYIKQYGPAVVIITVSLLLISIGVFLGIKTLGSNDKANAEEEMVSSLEQVGSILPAELNSLSPFTRSKEYKIITVKENAIVVIQIDDEKYEINLIGVKSKNNSSELLSKMTDELKGKKVTFEFDNVKVDNKNIYGYVYLNNKFYNEQILADGVGELKAERKNINKLDILLAAEIKARHSEKGIWKIV